MENLEKDEFIEKIKISTNLKSLMLELRNSTKKGIVEEYTDYLNDGYDYEISISQRIWHIRNSNQIQKCQCGKGKRFEKLDKGYFATCGNLECKKFSKIDSYKSTCLEKYGVETHTQDKTIKEKIKNTLIERYGVDHNFKGVLREKGKATMLEKYGVEHALQNKEILEKRNKTCLENNGTLNIIGLERTLKTIKEKYGVDYIMDNNEIKFKVGEKGSLTKKNKLINSAIQNKLTITKFDEENNLTFICEYCGNEQKLSRPKFVFNLLKQTNPCEVCNPKPISKPQKELTDFIRTLTDFEVLENVRSLVKGKELDIYIKEVNLGFEFNGIYWHSDKVLEDKNYHLKKLNSFNEIGIKIINIWEDDWNFKQDIIKSIIKQLLNKSNKIFARKCKIDENINIKEIKSFLNENHLSGYCTASKHIGLRYNNELVCLMTIGKSRFEKGLELLRYVNKIDNCVIGGFSKILKRIKEIYKNELLISYRTKDFGIDENNVYLKNGFEKVKDTEIGYCYVIDGIRLNRMNFTKKKLIEKGYDKNKTESQIMLEDVKASKIYDCGNEKYKIFL